jgi:uncharacterized protein
MQILKLLTHKHLIKFVLFIFVLFFVYQISFAEKVEDLHPANYVNDFANIIDANKEAEINSQLKDLEDRTGSQVTVVTVQNMDGDYIEHFAVKLFESWKIGNAKLDNGALLLISVEDRQMRLEVGYGLESTLTDGISKYILDEIMRPAFRNGDYTGGAELAVAAITNTLLGGEMPQSTPKQTSSFPSQFLFNLFPLFFIFGFGIFQWLASVLGRTKSWWLGGVLGAMVGALVIGFAGLSILTELAVLILSLLGFLFDFFVSKNYKAHKQGILSGPPDWWSGGTWAPGSSTWTGSSGDSSWGGFGGGSSGGGGASSSW